MAPGPGTVRVDLLPWVAVPRVGRWWVQGRGLQRKQLSGFSETDSRTPERANGDLAPRGLCSAHSPDGWAQVPQPQ